MSNIKIRHIYHSGFSIEFDQIMIFIDVYNNLDDLQLNKDKKIYFFSTHSHGDHYNAKIFEFEKTYVTKYILSKDIDVDASAHVIKVEKGDKFTLDDIAIEVFGTTDLGVSFYLNYQGHSLYHSGDLNWWHWENNSIQSQENEKRDYQRELSLLLGKKIEFAFVPVDPRLGAFKDLALRYFAQNIKPKFIIPMHFSDHYEIMQDLSVKDVELIKIAKPLSVIYRHDLDLHLK